MKYKILISFLVIMLILFCFFTVDNSEEKNNLYIENFQSYQDRSINNINYLFSYGFENEENVTIAQLLTLFCRLNGVNPSNYLEVKEYCQGKINLPNYYVYNSVEWADLWKFIMSTDTVFEKVDEDRYILTIIPGLKVYLNQQGYDLMNKGLIPPQLAFYSLGTINKLDDSVMNSQSDFGFLLEVLMALDYESRGRQSRSDCVKENIKKELLNLNYEKDFNIKDVNLYNYYALSNYGQLVYFKDKGLFQDYSFKELFSYVNQDSVVNLIIELEL